MSSSTILGVAASLIITITLFELLRRHRLREKHALVWFLVAVGALVITIFPRALVWLSDALHVQVPANLLFFLASLFLMAMNLQHSSEIGRLEQRVRTLAEELAILRLRADDQAAGTPAPGLGVEASAETGDPDETTPRGDE